MRGGCPPPGQGHGLHVVPTPPVVLWCLWCVVVAAAAPAAEPTAPVYACLRLSAAEIHVQCCFQCSFWFVFRFKPKRCFNAVF